MEAQVPINVLRELVFLNKDTGDLIWRDRPRAYFKTEMSWKTWNTKWAGKKAFNTRSGNGYLHGALFNKKIFAHRVVYALLYGEWPSKTIDHIDGNRTNNRPSNLRNVEHQTNCRNQPISAANTSGVTGVSFDSNRGVYEAYITVDAGKVSLGRFPTLGEAKDARLAANLQFGFHANHGRASS